MLSGGLFNIEISLEYIFIKFKYPNSYREYTS